jgi:hypothetical protein
MADTSVGGSSTDSLINQGSTSRDHQKLASQGPQQTITTQSTFPSNFIVEAGAVVGVDDTTQRTADYYRDGDPYRSGLARFIDPFQDEQASIRIISNVDSIRSEDIIPAYTKFIMESVQETHQERSQIVETFGQFYTFFYGERPPMYNFQGILINTQNANWVSDFMLTYESFLRGTRCVEQKAQAVITYGGRQIQGYILSTNNQTQAVNQEGVRFGFQMVVTKRRFIGFSEDAGLVTSDGRSSASDGTISAIIDAIAGPRGIGFSDPAVSQAYGAARGVVENGAPSSGILDTGNIVVG